MVLAGGEERDVNDLVRGQRDRALNRLNVVERLAELACPDLHLLAVKDACLDHIVG